MNIPEPVRPEKVGVSSQRLERVRALCRRYVDEEKLAGVTVLVARRGQVILCDAYGQRDREAGQPMTLDTVFRIYSMTKPITTVAALMLLEEGKLLLLDPVAKHLPEFADVKVCVGMDVGGPILVEPERPMTIQDLMRHTSGLSYGWFVDTPVDQMYRDAQMGRREMTLAEAVTQLAKLPLAFHPGRAWRYSYATDVLGRIVEVISGQTLDAFFQERIFDPLGMTETGFYVRPEQVERFAALYNLTGQAVFTPILPENLNGTLHLMEAPAESRFTKPPVFLSGGGGLVSTTGDYLRFCQMLLNRGELDGVRLLGPKTVELMTMNHLPSELIPIGIGEKDYGYGFGLGVKVLVDVAASAEPGSLGIYGWGGAASTVFDIDPQEELITIFMTQFMPSGYYPIRRELQVALYQSILE